MSGVLVGGILGHDIERAVDDPICSPRG